jgi:hypothetical protein
VGRKVTDVEQELYRRVDEVLYYVWDPIGVAHSPAARDEYQGYLPRVFSMLQDGADATSVAAYLKSICTERMGLHQKDENSKNCRRAAGGVENHDLPTSVADVRQIGSKLAISRFSPKAS